MEQRRSEQFNRWIFRRSAAVVGLHELHLSASAGRWREQPRRPQVHNQECVGQRTTGIHAADTADHGNRVRRYVSGTGARYTGKRSDNRVRERLHQPVNERQRDDSATAAQPAEQQALQNPGKPIHPGTAGDHRTGRRNKQRTSARHTTGCEPELEGQHRVRLHRHDSQRGVGLRQRDPSDRVHRIAIHDGIHRKEPNAFRRMSGETFVKILAALVGFLQVLIPLMIVCCKNRSCKKKKKDDTFPV